jgi:ribonuclease HI
MDSLASEWTDYLSALNGEGITLADNNKDILIWAGGDQSGAFTVKNVYDSLISIRSWPIRRGWKLDCWHWSIQLKITLFFLLATENRVLTWEVLLKKGWIGPSQCFLCRKNTEDNPHLFIHCVFTRRVWASLTQQLKLTSVWTGPSLADSMEGWLQNKSVPKVLPLLTSWFIWNERNLAIFEGKIPSVIAVVIKTLNALHKRVEVTSPQVLRIKPFFRLQGYTVAFFDGATKVGGSRCGAGGTLKCIGAPDYRWLICCGVGTNTKAELMGAWASLCLANLLNIYHLQVLGDSKVIIEWLSKKGNLQVINLEGWKVRIRELMAVFQGINFQHIYRESNEEADNLSKRALHSPIGKLIYFPWDGESEGPTKHINVF